MSFGAKVCVVLLGVEPEFPPTSLPNPEQLLMMMLHPLVITSNSLLFNEGGWVLASSLALIASHQPAKQLKFKKKVFNRHSSVDLKVVLE